MLGLRFSSDILGAMRLGDGKLSSFTRVSLSWQVLELMLASTDIASKDTPSKDFDKDMLRHVAMVNYDLELA